MSHKVWKYMNKDIFTSCGAKEIEVEFDAIMRILKKATSEDLIHLKSDIDNNSFVTLAVFDEIGEY